MAVKLDDTKVRMGYAIPVKNTEKRHTAEKGVYYAVYVEECEGGGEKWLLFTENELVRMKTVVIDGVTASWKPGRMFPVSSMEHPSVLARIVSLRFANLRVEGAACVIPRRLLERAAKRAEDSPEDIPEMSFIERLMN